VYPDKHGINIGGDQFQVVVGGCYKIYPCPHEDFMDALEVRFLGKEEQGCDGEPMISIRQEIYLDYGEEKAVEYVMNAVVLQEAERLLPKNMARADP
jgi:hypothetical protein